MSVQFTPLNNDTHKSLKVSPNTGYQHIQNQQAIPVIVHEFSRIATEFPIVFIKNTNTGEFQPVALMGVKPNENVCVGDVATQIPFMPEGAGFYPLILTPDAQNAEQLFVAVDSESSLVNEVEGESLFTHEGEESEFLAGQKKALIQHYENSQITRQFSQYLADLDLLAPQNLVVNLPEGDAEIKGIYLISEQKLSALDNDKFNEIRQKGILPAIYAHLVSLHQIKRLVSRASV